MPGQQFEYGFDDIGNRTTVKSGGDSQGGIPRLSEYESNLRNQYTSRSVPESLDVIGLANANAAVTVNGQTPYRHGEYFQASVPVGNCPDAVQYPEITVTASRSGYSTEQETGHTFVPGCAEDFEYDADGNLLHDDRWDYTWDAENRLVRMVARTTTGPQQWIEFQYDWRGRRVAKTVWANVQRTDPPAVSLKFLYDGWNLLAEIDAKQTPATVTRHYVWGLDLSGSLEGAGGVGGLLAVYSEGTAHFAAYDGNGNVMALVDSTTGRASAEYLYGPFGELLARSGAMAEVVPIRFSSKYEDAETGLCYYGHRYYNPSTGRWLNNDPIGEGGGLNLHGFARNSPPGFIDSDGRVVLQSIDQTTENLMDPYKPWYHHYNWDAIGVGVVRSVWVVFSLGTACKNDRLADRNLAGEITDGQFWAGASVNTAVALGSVATGGVAANAVAGAGGNLVVQGAAGGFASSLFDVAGTRGGYAAIDIRYEGTWTGDAIQVGTGTLLGTAFGSGAQLQQALRPGSGLAGQMTLGKVDPTLGQLQQVPSKPGFFDVIAHGNKNSINYLTADEFAALLRKTQSYNGQNLRLLSCQCGQGVNSLGSQLARRTMVVVKAPNNFLWPDGTIQNGMRLPSGQWLRLPPTGDFSTFSPFNWYMPLNWRPDDQH